MYKQSMKKKAEEQIRGDAVNWVRHGLIIALVVIATVLGAFYPRLRIPTIVTGGVFGCVVAFMSYRWHQWQYWATITALLILFAPFNLFIEPWVEHFQALLMFLVAIVESVVALIVIVAVCPEVERYRSVGGDRD
jgi:hypothetical protein